jgi:SAM-dependent methyltransferase
MRKVCRSCGSKQLLSILSLGNLYLSDFTKSNKKPPKFPLTLVLCTICKLLQLKDTTPPGVLYTDNYGYRSGINKTMRNELQDIVASAQQFMTNKKDTIVVDIGANDGTLLSFYDKDIYRVGFEPVKKFASDSKIYANHIFTDYFNSKSFEKKLQRKKAQVVTAISCFYDIENPNEFIEDVKKILDEKGVFIIQQNYLVGMLKQNAFDNIVHEHLEYYSLLSLETLLKRHNLEVFDVILTNVNGGSFRTYICRKGIFPVNRSVIKLRISEKKLHLEDKKIYLDFSNRIKKTMLQLHQFVERKVKEGKKVYVYGASTRGNTLLQHARLNKSLIAKAVERNKEKWGMKIASLGIPIISEKQAREEKPDYMLVLPWFFREEFLKREHEYLQAGGHFIFPLPSFKIV